MASIQIPNLPAVISLNGTEQLEVVQGGVSSRATTLQLVGIATGQTVPFPISVGGTGATTAAGARTNLGLGTIAVQDASAVAITGGTIQGVAITLDSLDNTPVGAVTPSTGAFTTLSATTPLPVSSGGTGQASNWTQWGAIYASTTGVLSSTAAGITGQVLVGNTGSAPTWGAATGVAVTSLSFGTTGLTPNSATTGAIVVAGTLVAANGGTGINSLGTGVATALGQNVTGSGGIVLATAPTIGSPVISGGTIDNAAIGGTTPAAGSFTTLSASGISEVGAGDGTASPSNGTIVGPRAAGLNIAGTNLIIQAGNGTGSGGGGSLSFQTAPVSGSSSTPNTMTTALVINSAQAATFSGTLTASKAFTANGANAAISLSPTGTGTVAISPVGALTINPTAASTINNTSIGATTASTGAFTSATVPSVIGGVGTASSLTLQSTSGVGATDTIVFKTGNAGAVTALTIASNGNATFLSTSTTAVGTLSLTNPLTVGNGGTGLTAFGTGVATALGQNVNGSGAITLTTSPAFVTPTLGVASATTINKVTLTAPATGSTLTILDGKTFTVNNTMTLAAGADGQTWTFPSTSDTVVTLGATQTLTAKTLTTPVLNGIPTGTGVATAAIANTLVLRDGSGNISNASFNSSFLSWFNALPTTLPGSAGVAWNNGGTIAVS